MDAETVKAVGNVFSTNPTWFFIILGIIILFFGGIIITIVVAHIAGVDLSLGKFSITGKSKGRSQEDQEKITEGQLTNFLMVIVNISNAVSSLSNEENDKVRNLDRRTMIEKLNKVDDVVKLPLERKLKNRIFGNNEFTFEDEKANEHYYINLAIKNVVEVARSKYIDFIKNAEFDGEDRNKFEELIRFKEEEIKDEVRDQLFYLPNNINKQEMFDEYAAELEGISRKILDSCVELNKKNREDREIIKTNYKEKRIKKLEDQLVLADLSDNQKDIIRTQLIID